MKKIALLVAGIFAIIILSLFTYWMYYKARYQMVYIDSYPFIHDKWIGSIRMVGFENNDTKSEKEKEIVPAGSIKLDDNK